MLSGLAVRLRPIVRPLFRKSRKRHTFLFPHLVTLQPPETDTSLPRSLRRDGWWLEA
ncbi:hypothetical protein [Roseibium aggregatum]|uniref:Uncharacterized protein n=1 Tax=Roseibium aggregatum TaxID=187304 RepID=A0A939E9S6_9HYPH|nr:hypothetical protein [Roseibium aggregatum]MBN9668958.1 hypothetical protein [Roseibium aggregatum]